MWNRIRLWWLRPSAAQRQEQLLSELVDAVNGVAIGLLRTERNIGIVSQQLFESGQELTKAIDNLEMNR